MAANDRLRLPHGIRDRGPTSLRLGNAEITDAICPIATVLLGSSFCASLTCRLGVLNGAVTRLLKLAWFCRCPADQLASRCKRLLASGSGERWVMPSEGHTPVNAVSSIRPPTAINAELGRKTTTAPTRLKAQ